MKLRLDFFKSIGGKVAKGDVVIDSDGNRVAIKSSALLNSYNLANHSDDKCFIESFALRKNTGEQPCGDDMPVLVEHSVSECLDGEAHKAFMCEWDLNDGCIKSWEYDLEALIKMQAEHDAKEAEPVKPIYTQAMKDAGEKIKVGADFFGPKGKGVCTVLSLFKTSKGDECIAFEYGECSTGTCWNSRPWVIPIDTRTPKEKQVARVVKHMNMFTFETDEEMVKSMQQAGLLAEIK